MKRVMKRAKNNKRFSLVILALMSSLVAFSLVGCNGTEDVTPTLEEREAETEEDKFSMGGLEIEIDRDYTDETDSIASTEETVAEETIASELYSNKDLEVGLNGVGMVMSEEDATQIDFIISSAFLTEEQIREMVYADDNFKSVEDRDSLYQEVQEKRGEGTRTSSSVEEGQEEQGAELFDSSSDAEIQALIDAAQQELIEEQKTMETVVLE